MKKQYLLLLIIFYSLLCYQSAANELSFSQISSRDGLSQNTVRTLVEDDMGFIWAGTMDGLNRYDGSRVKTYRPQFGNLYSLSDHRIKEITKDRDGYLWIKTYENQYNYYNPEKDSFVPISNKDKQGRMISYTDVYESTEGSIWLWGRNAGVHRISKDTKKEISGKNIIEPAGRTLCNFLFEDSAGFLWTGGEKGLFQISPKDNSVNKILADSTFYFHDGLEADQKLWFVTRDCKIVCYDMITKQIRITNSGINANSLYKIAILNRDELLVIARGNGVYSYNINSDSFMQHSWMKDKDLNGSIDFLKDKNNDLWIYNHSGYMWYLRQSVPSAKKIQFIPADVLRTIDAERYFVYIDSTGLIWITTYGNGLFCYDPLNDKIRHYQNKPSSTNSLASDYLLSLTEDRYGNIWVGSDFAGIIRITKSDNPSIILHPEKRIALGRNNNVRTIMVDSKQRIWVGTKNGSLYIYNNLSDKPRVIKEDMNPYSIIETPDNKIWIATKGNGIYVYDNSSLKQLNQFLHTSSDQNSLSHDAFFTILFDNKERLWFGSFGAGINLPQYNEKGDITGFRHFFENDGNKSYTRCLYQDRKGRIWAGTSDGLICFNPEELINNPEAYASFRMDLSKSNTLSSNDIKTIFEDSSGNLWIGTAGGGLNLFIESDKIEEGCFTAYTTLNGLADNFISGIQEDNGYLWISSENGISRFDMNDHSFMTYHFSENTYGNHFNENSFSGMQDGTLLWGSLDGLLAFNPNSFIYEKAVPEVKITGFQIEGLEAYENNLFEKSISYTDKVRLNHLQNTFTIEYATLILHHPEKNMYTFMLDNYDKKWSTANHSNSVTYRNLPHGRYVFKVKGSNHDGVWNDNITELEVIITPPFYKSTYAYVFYLILFVLVLYIILYVFNRMNILNNTIEMEKQLTNHKLRFFTNISHEFRTPLTLIRGVVEKLNDIKDIPPSVAKQLNTLNRNSTHLSRLIDELLEFRKMQNSSLTLSLQKQDIISFAHEIFNGFKEVADQKAIQYTFSPDRESFQMYFDKKKVDKIINNLISNSLKFTNNEGVIDVSISIVDKNNTCRISVKDNGLGIPKDKQHLIFSRFMQINFSSTGTGVGLSLVKEFTDVHKGKVWYESNPEGGSIFIVELSTNESVYDPEQFVSELTVPEGSYTPNENVLVHETEAIPENVHEQKLLIIEDNSEVRNFLFDEFSAYFTVYTAEDGKKGIDKAIEINPDLIICDIMMPEMDGFEVTKLLKNEFQTCHIPIILLTAHSSIDHQLEGIKSGADAYIMKPFSIKYLLTRVFKLIEQRETLKKRFTSGNKPENLSFIKDQKDKEFYAQIDKILDDNYMNSKFNIEKFVELVGMSRTNFYRKVKGITGLPPNDLIRIKRLQKAAHLLKNTNLNVSQVSYEVGIEDPFYFSKCFKAQYNCSPSQYKEMTLSSEPEA